MKEKLFKAVDGMTLNVKHRKSAVFLELTEESKDRRFNFDFDKKTFKEFCDYIKQISNESWVNVNPKEAFSCGSDYDEFYDRETDNNGYLSIRKSVKGLSIERPSLESLLLYKFNKTKMESFIYDLDNLDEWE